MTTTTTTSTPTGSAIVEAFAQRFDVICGEVEKVMVELRPVIEDVLIAMLAEGKKSSGAFINKHFPSRFRVSCNGNGQRC